MTRIWNNYVLETKVEFGSAARGGRGRYTGQKIHRLICEYVVAVSPSAMLETRTIGADFVRTGKPQLFSCQPACGCTRGQRAGLPFAQLTAEKVTCTKCAK